MRTRGLLVALALITCGVSGSAAWGQPMPKAVEQPPPLLRDHSFPGEIRMFAGPTCPKGWVECDGRTLQRAQYSNPTTRTGLWDAIEYYWGGKTDKGEFDVPDLRGVFVRGWNNGKTKPDDKTGYDRDAGERDILNGAPQQKDRVGTYQPDQFKDHTHTLALASAAGDKANGAAGSGQNDLPQYPIVTGSGGGGETRGVNAAVLFCVRASTKDDQ